MKILQAIWDKAAYIAIALGVLIFLGSIFTTRDVPKAFAIDNKQVNRTMTPEELALLYIENRKDFEVLDLRQLESYNRGHIKNAISCPACHNDKNDAKEKQKEMPDFNKKFIIYTQTGSEPIRLPRALASHKNLFLLSGGYESWENKILQPVTITEDDSEEEVYRKKRLNAIYKYFTGKEQLPAAPESGTKTIKKKSSHSLGKSEGC
jgi:rhodanese-related sulfurtransferase